MESNFTCSKSGDATFSGSQIDKNVITLPTVLLLKLEKTNKI